MNIGPYGIVIPCFIGFHNHTTQMFEPRGTGFTVSKKMCTDNGQDHSLFFMVTAAHVIDKLKECGAKEIQICYNSKVGKNKEIFPTKYCDWFKSDDLTVDVAIYQFQYDPSIMEHFYFDENNLLTQEKIEEFNFGLGDEVFVPGLFNQHTRTDRNVPIVRIGNIASFSGEPIQTRLGEMEAHLIECRSIGGLSGSPVFATKGHIFWAGQIKHTSDNNPAFGLLGMIHGHFDERIHNNCEGGVVYPDSVNMGIAIVTPGQKIFDLIEDYISTKFKQRDT